MSLPFLILGQGLAGTAVAWQLWERGERFQIVDRGESVTCSKIAAGLITPITGMRLNLSWRFGEHHREARGFYRGIEERTGARFYHPLTALRLFRDEKMRDLWFQKRLGDPAIEPYLSQPQPQPLVAEDRVRHPLGGFEQQGAAYVDTSVYLESSRAWFDHHGCFRRAEIDPSRLRMTSTGGVEWEGEAFRAAVICVGWQAALDPRFDWLPFRSARGTILDGEVDLVGESRSLTGAGCWVLPRGGGRVRVGPTYEIGFDPAAPNHPSPRKVEELKDKVRSLVVPEVEYRREQTAVRPIVQGRQLILGRHPGQPGIAVLNGLGSKGAVRSPWAARHLVEHLLDGRPLDPAVDLQAQG